jgi:hypothetical protein
MHAGCTACCCWEKYDSTDALKAAVPGSATFWSPSKATKALYYEDGQLVIEAKGREDLLTTTMSPESSSFDTFCMLCKFLYP